MIERIALFSPSLHGGGSERVMLNLAYGFAEKGYRVDMVLSSAEGEYIEELDHRVHLVNLGAKRVATSLPALVRYLCRYKPFALLSTQQHANVIALIAGSMPGIETRIFVREVTSPLRTRAKEKTIWTSLISSLARRTYSRAHRVIAVCRDLKLELADEMSIPLERIAVIYNPIRTEDIRRRAQEPLDHDWFDDPSQIVILSIGRLERVKGFDTLIRALALVRREMQVKLVILGDGRLRDDLTQLAESLSLGADVDLPGFVRNPYAYLARADALVLSSLWEGLPNVLLDALTLGIPIVATDCNTGPREILRGGKDGLLVPVNDIQALSDGIISCLTTSKRKTVSPDSLRRFDFDRVIDEYLELMRT